MSHPSGMKAILQFCIRFGYLPRRRWFFNLVVKHLWWPASVRDVGQLSGWIEMPPNVSPKASSDFVKWWAYCSKRPEIAGDHPQ